MTGPPVDTDRPLAEMAGAFLRQVLSCAQSQCTIMCIM